MDRCRRELSAPGTSASSPEATPAQLGSRSPRIRSLRQRTPPPRSGRAPAAITSLRFPASIPPIANHGPGAFRGPGRAAYSTRPRPGGGGGPGLGRGRPDRAGGRSSPLPVRRRPPSTSASAWAGAADDRLLADDCGRAIGTGRVVLPEVEHVGAGAEGDVRAVRLTARKLAVALARVGEHFQRGQLLPCLPCPFCLSWTMSTPAGQHRVPGNSGRSPLLLPGVAATGTAVASDSLSRSSVPFAPQVRFRPPSSQLRPARRRPHLGAAVLAQCLDRGAGQRVVGG